MARRAEAGVDIYDVARPHEPKLITQWADRRTWCPPVRFRRPVRLHFADRRWLCRQYRHDPRFGRSHTPDRGGTGDGSRGQWMAGGEAYPWHDLGRATLPTIRYGSAIVFVSAIGTTAFSSSTSPTYRGRGLCPVSTPVPLFPIQCTTCLPMPQTIKGRRILIVADEDVAALWPTSARFRLDIRHYPRGFIRCRSQHSRRLASIMTAVLNLI